MNERGAPIEYKAMDILDMKEIENGSWDFVLDKGTLDALCSDNKEETKKKVSQYLNEVQRVLNPKGGIYICISLLQDFVMDALVDHFNKGTGNNQYKDYVIDFRI